MHLIEGTIHSALSRDPALVQQDALAGELGTAVLRYLKPAQPDPGLTPDH